MFEKIENLKNNPVLSEMNLLEACQELGGVNTFILYVGQRLSTTAQFIVDALNQKVLKIIVQVKDLEDGEWYVVNENGSVYSKGDEEQIIYNSNLNG